MYLNTIMMTIIANFKQPNRFKFVNLEGIVYKIVAVYVNFRRRQLFLRKAIQLGFLTTFYSYFYNFLVFFYVPITTTYILVPKLDYF